MKSKLLCLSLTSLFLLGCAKKVKSITVEEVKNKISNNEDFIFLLTSKTCGHCQNLKKEYKKTSYTNIFYEINVDDLFKGVKENDSKYIEEYKYLADLITLSYSSVESYALNDTYKDYFELEYADLYGKDYYVNGYIDIVYPLSFFYIDGEIVNFEVGDYSSKLIYVMDKYNSEATSNE